MGKFSFRDQLQNSNTEKMSDQTQNYKLNKKELIVIVSTVFVIFFVGFCFGFILDGKRVRMLKQTIYKVDPMFHLEQDLQDKLKETTKILNKIDDEDLKKVLLERKSTKIQLIKEQLIDIQKFRSNNISIVNLYYENKKNELKQKEILYYR
jgi:hypothetical protein